MATLSDVAKAAGVSLSTASRAINGSKDRIVNPVLRERVLAAAAELRYSPNAAAQAIARGRTTTLSLIVPDITDPYFSSIASGVTSAARGAGHTVMLGVTGHEREIAQDLINTGLTNRSSGLILVGGLYDDPGQLGLLQSALDEFRTVTDSDVALVAQPVLNAHSVIPDNHGGASALGHALLGQGYRRLAVLAGPEKHLTARDRTRGFAEAVAAGGGQVTATLAGAFDRDGGFAAMSRLIADGELPDAVFAVNDVMAVGALAACREAGISVPDQVGLAGFDDIPTLADVVPALTTVRVPMEALGERAVGLVLGHHPERVSELLATEVVLRDSTPRLNR